MLKQCPKCKRELSVAQFNRDKNKKDGCSGYCKSCNAEYQKKHYKNNKSDYQSNKRNYRKKLTDVITDVKGKSECERCGENHPAVLDFHHEDPNEKEFSIASVVKLGFNTERLLKEMEKCKILCSNCHRKLHWDEKHKE